MCINVPFLLSYNSIRCFIVENSVSPTVTVRILKPERVVSCSVGHGCCLWLILVWDRDTEQEEQPPEWPRSSPALQAGCEPRDSAELWNRARRDVRGMCSAPLQVLCRALPGLGELVVAHLGVCGNWPFSV